MPKLTEQHLSGYRFDAVFLRECSFRDESSGFERLTAQFPDSVKGAIEVRIRLAPDGKFGAVGVKFEVTPVQPTAESFTSLAIDIEGRFSVVGDAPTVPFDVFLRSNGPAILFPFIRQTIADITSRTRLGELLLPPLNVTNVAGVGASAVSQP